MKKLVSVKGMVIFVSTVLLIACLIIMVMTNSKTQTGIFLDNQQDKLALITEKCRTEIENRIDLYEKILNITSIELQNGYLSKESYTGCLNSIVSEHSEICRAYLAFEDDSFFTSDPLLSYTSVPAEVTNNEIKLITEPYIDQSNQALIISFSKSITTPEGLKGILVFDFPLDNLNAMINHLYSSQTGGAYLVSANGNIVTYIDETFLPKIVDGEVIFLQVEEVQSQVTVLKNIDKYVDNDVYVQQIIDYDQKEKYAATTTISNTGWILGVNVPLSDFTSAIRQVMQDQIPMILLAVFMSFISIVTGLIFYFAERSRMIQNQLFVTTLEKKNKTLIEAMNRDPLTGAYNRRYLASYMKTIAGKSSFCILMADIDFFKSINDTYGHGVGDDILVAITKTMQKCVRTDDPVARVGGEEFVIVLENMPLKEAHELAEQIRLSVADIRINRRLKITVSIGLIESQPNGTFDEVLNKADKYLYQAKNSGRNKVCSDYNSSIS